MGFWLATGGSGTGPLPFGELVRVTVAGGLVGMALAPAMGWLLLRKVPLGVAIAYAAVGHHDSQ